MNLNKALGTVKLCKKSQNSLYGVEHFTHVSMHQHDSIAQPHSYTMNIITCEHKIGYSNKDYGFKQCKLVMLSVNCDDQNKGSNHIT